MLRTFELKNFEKLRTAQPESKFTGSYKKKRLLKIPLSMMYNMIGLFSSYDIGFEGFSLKKWPFLTKQLRSKLSQKDYGKCVFGLCTRMLHSRFQADSKQVSRKCGSKFRFLKFAKNPDIELISNFQI